MHSQTTPPIAVTDRQARRAELVFEGVEQAGASFEGRVFLNNPQADEHTAREPSTGYAGSFHVYGYGEAAPPQIADARRTRAPGSGPVAPIEKRLHADEAALGAALEGADELTVTVVPIPADPGGEPPARPFDRVQVLFDPAR